MLRTLFRVLIGNLTFILIIALTGALAPAIAAAEPEMESSSGDEGRAYRRIVNGARLAATLDYLRLYETAGPVAPALPPALVYDIFFDTAHQRLLRHRYQRTSGDLFWAQVPPRTGGAPLMPVARVLAQNPERAALINLADVPAFKILNILRVRSVGRDVLVIEGVGDQTKGDSRERAAADEAFETFLNEFLTEGTTVIVADEARRYLEVSSSLRRLSTGFPDGTSIFDAWDCERWLAVQ